MQKDLVHRRVVEQLRHARGVMSLVEWQLQQVRGVMSLVEWQLQQVRGVMSLVEWQRECEGRAAVALSPRPAGRSQAPCLGQRQREHKAKAVS